MIEEILKQIELITERAGYECVHVGIKNDFGRTKIQILIDMPGGINVNDCENVSRRINKFLDESLSRSDIPGLNGKYYLEVSSPGIERPLYKPEDYVRFQGREAKVRLNGLFQGRKTFTGIIKNVGDDNGSPCRNVNLICNDVEVKIPWDLIKGGNLVYKFDEGKTKRGKTKK